MGRPREFDEEEVVQSALHAFWTQGYGATSIPDLLSAMEIERGSLYKAFGDKHSLFERALEHYLRAGRQALKQVLEESDSPLRGIELWLEQVHRGCSGEHGGPGCLAVNAMVELAPSDAAIRARLARHWSLVKRRLEKTLARAQALGEVRQDLAVRHMSEWLVRSVTGIAVFARQGDRTNMVPAMLELLRR